MDSKFYFPDVLCLSHKENINLVMLIVKSM